MRIGDIMWIATILYILLVVFGIKKCLDSKVEFKKNQFKIALIVLFVSAFILRLILALYQSGHADLQVFGRWARRVVEAGTKDFYTPDELTDYPPGYVGVLWLLGLLQKVFGTVPGMPLDNLILKFPALIFDFLITGFFIKIAKDKIGQVESVLFGAAYLFAPVVVFNSAVWGQVDVVFTFFLILVMYYSLQGKVEYTYIPFMIGVLMKPQMLMYGPVLLLVIIEHVFIRDFSWRKVGMNFWLGMCSLMGSALYIYLFNVETVINQYTDTMSSYPYASVNAYNFWGLLGKNWTPQEEIFLGLTYKSWGYIGIFLAFILTVFVWYQNIRKKKTNNYFLLSAIFVFTVFTFSVRMHERYLFPVIVLLLFAYIYDRDKKLLVINLIISMVNFLNVIHVYYYYDPYDFHPKNMMIIMVSMLTVLVYFTFIYLVWKKIHTSISLKNIKEVKVQSIEKIEDAKLKGDISEEKSVREKGNSIEELDDTHRKMKRKDWIIVSVITLIYACIALFHLGDMNTPESPETIYYNDGIYINLPTEEDQVTVQYYLGGLENRNFDVYIWNEETSEWDFNQEHTMVSVYRWGELIIQEPCQYICLMVADSEAEVVEIAVRDANGDWINITTSEGTLRLLDEKESVPKYRSYLNGTIFDEIYHARTAYELIHHIPTYEWTHPPLGKLIMSLGIRAFGMNPFGWRFMGTFLGILMLPIFYIFAKNMFKKTWLATIITTLFATDFMHFTQTRIATIDVYVVFFIIFMYYFMYRYYIEEHSDARMKDNWKMLALSGLFMGFAISSKWTGAYAALGLAVIFFIALIKKDWIGSEKPHKRFYQTILACFLFFVAIPFFIYVICYIPVIRQEGAGLLEKVWKEQIAMFGYHQGVHSDHPYSSKFYEWPIIVRPILYYVRRTSENLSESIAAFGNPLIWWSGIPAFFYLLYVSVKHKSKNALFIVIGYLAQYLPWVFIGRTVFIYHYFPSVPFVILMIGYAMNELVKNNKAAKKWCYVYMGVSIFLFFLFYPVLSGYPIRIEFAQNCLRWFDSWVISM